MVADGRVLAVPVELLDPLGRCSWTRDGEAEGRAPRAANRASHVGFDTAALAVHTRLPLEKLAFSP